MTDAEVKATRKQVTHLMRHPNQHPSRYVPDMPPPLTHYALDIEKPPVIACDAPDNPPSSTNPMDVTCTDCMSHPMFPESVARTFGVDGTVPIQPEAPAVIRGYDVLTTAALLLSEDAENAEYDRAIVELVSSLIGATSDDYELMTRILRALKQGM